MSAQDITRSLLELRELVSQLASSAVTEPPSATKLHRGLGLTRTFAWKLARFLTTISLPELAEYLPTPEGIVIFASRAEQCGISSALTRQIVDRYTAAHAKLTVHGSPATLAAILRHATDGSAEPVPVATLREAFRCNSVIWGVQATSLVRSAFIVPDAENPGMMSYYTTFLLTGLRILRRCEDCLISRERPTRSDMTAFEGERHAAVPRGSKPLLPDDYMTELCSPSGVSVVRRVGHDLSVMDSVVGLPVGDSPTCQLVRATCFRQLHSVKATTSHYDGAVSLEVRLPVESAIVDFYVHPSCVAGEAIPTIAPLLDGRPWYEVKRSDNLAIDSRLQQTAPGQELEEPQACPNYRQAIRKVAQRHNIRTEELMHWRLSVAFPPAPCVLILGFPLPQA